MLSRVADSLYWINRYVERAENISRFVEVSEAMALDCPPGSAEPWLPLIDASGDRDLFDELYPGGGPQQVVEFLVRAEANPSSIVNCIAFARENARQIRDVVTTEMWEQINGLYWTLLESDSFWHQPPQEQLREIRRGCQLFYGITDATLSRDLSWQFSRLGRCSIRCSLARCATASSASTKPCRWCGAAPYPEHPMTWSASAASPWPAGAIPISMSSWPAGSTSPSMPCRQISTICMS